MEKRPPFVITIVGPESSGKTTLSQQLAGLFGSPWVPEFAREYLEKLDRPYVFEDLIDIARGQRELIQSQIENVLVNAESIVQKGTIKNVEPSVLFALQKAVAAQTSDFAMPLLVVDSGLLTIRMWALIKYGKTIDFVEEALAQDMTDLYLLKRPGKIWEPDPLREAPTLVERAWIYNLYLSELARNQRPFRII